MMFKVLAVLLGVTASTTAAKSGAAPAPVPTVGGIFCSDLSISSTAGSVDFSIQSAYTGTVDFEFDCTSSWGDASNCTLNDYDDEELSYSDWAYRSAYWDRDPEFLDPWNFEAPEDYEDSGIEFQAASYKIHIDDLNEEWWNPGYRGSCDE